MRKGFYKHRGRKAGNDSLYLSNECKIPSGSLQGIKTTTLGRIIRIGWDKGDFNNNTMTFRQFVKIPRIFSKKL